MTLGCAADVVKSLTVICTVLVGREVITPPLLAVRVSVSFPMGHIKLALAPDAVPQLPVQLKVTGQLSGSVAEPVKLTFAPVVPDAFKVWLCPAFAVGSVAVIAASAFTSPKPSMSFGAD